MQQQQQQNGVPKKDDQKKSEVGHLERHKEDHKEKYKHTLLLENLENSSRPTPKQTKALSEKSPVSEITAEAKPDLLKFQQNLSNIVAAQAPQKQPKTTNQASLINAARTRSVHPLTTDPSQIMLFSEAIYKALVGAGNIKQNVAFLEVKLDINGIINITNRRDNLVVFNNPVELGVFLSKNNITGVNINKLYEDLYQKYSINYESIFQKWEENSQHQGKKFDL